MNDFSVGLYDHYESIPVSTVYCVGKNYPLHAAEMGGVVPPEPVIFIKPRTAVISDGGTIRLPNDAGDLHHEVELVAVIGERMSHVSSAAAVRGIIGYAVGLDMTLRERQTLAKKKGEPWAIAKGFDTSAPIGPVIPAAEIADPHALTLRLSVNGEVRQEGGTGDMIYTIPNVVAFLSSFFTLLPGDLIMTGTPHGVGPVVDGDRLVASIVEDERATLSVSVAS